MYMSATINFFLVASPLTMTNQVPKPLSEIPAVPVTSKMSIQGTTQPIPISSVSESDPTEDVEEGIATPKVHPLAQGSSPSHFKIPTLWHRRLRIHMSGTGFMEALMIGLALVVLLMYVVFFGACDWHDFGS